MSYTGTPRFFYATANTQPTALPSMRGTQLDILNTTGGDLIFDHGAGTVAFNLPTGNSKIFHAQANAQELRVSVTNGQVNFQGEIWG